jgi:DNA polymerase (family X)
VATLAGGREEPTVPRTNDEVARLLDELAVLTELAEGDPNAFRVRAYQNAERAVRGLQRDVGEMSASELARVKGLGKSTAAKIREYVETGTIAKLDELRAAHPRGQRDLLKVPGLGTKTVGLLQSTLGITDLPGLQAAIDDGRLAALPGMGTRTVENLAAAIGKLGLTSKDRRVPIADALPVAERTVAALRQVPGVVDAAYAGSLRRFRETIGDLDVLVASDDPAPVGAALLALDDIDRVIGSGETKTSVVTRDGLQIDLRVVPPGSFGAAMVYFTGSKAHNIRLRQRALERDWTLNEYALAHHDDTAEVVAGATEEDVYAALGLPWIAPELREDDGEIEAAAAGRLPDLPVLDDIRGDLHVHTDLSGDGHEPLETMVAALVERGRAYIGITDHAENLTINGVSREAMTAQRVRLRELEQRRGDVRLLHGAELNIGVDGSLDYDPAFLASFDWLVASVHSHFGRSVAEQTDRVVRAIREPSVTAIGHLTGRMLGRRPGIELDVDRVLEAAAATGTAIEINASLHRLDAPAGVIREGVARGVRFVISTDAHRIGDLDRMRFGVAQARRAGAPKDAIVNTRDTAGFLAWLDEVRGA